MRVPTLLADGLRLVRPGRRRHWVLVLSLTALSSLVEAAGGVVVIVIMRVATIPDAPLDFPMVGDLRQRFPDATNETIITGIIAMTAVFFVLRAAISVLQRYIAERLTHREGVLVASELVDGYLHMPYEFHLRVGSATLTRNAYQSVNDVVDKVFDPTIAIFGDLVVVAALFVVLLVRAPVVTIAVVLVLVPSVLVVLRVVQPRVGRLGVHYQALAEGVLSGLAQHFQGIRDITVSGAQEHFHSSFVRDKVAQARTLYLLRTAVEVPRIILETVLYVLVLALLGVTMVREGSIQNSLAIIGLFAYAAMRVMPAMNRIVGNANLLRFGRAAVEPVLHDLELVRTARRPAATAVAPLPFEAELRATRVGFTYPGVDRPALEDIDVVVPRGQTLGIVGPTGGGKSTLLDVLIGLVPPSAGQVTVDGVDVGEHREAWLAAVGMVHQSVFLFDSTLRENIALGTQDESVDETLLAEAVRLAQLDELVEQLPNGLDERVGERGLRLSGGQRQRVAIARALYRRPAVLVFDEGTSALDTRTEDDLLQALAALRGRLTLLVVAHRISTVRQCDEIVVVGAGRVVDRGSYDELLSTSSAFRQLAT